MIVLLYIGIAQALFLVLLLIGKKENHKANLLLAALIFSYSIYILQVLGISLELYKVVPHIFTLFAGIPILFGPLHYLYVRTLVTEKELSVKKDYIHFLPYFLNWSLYFHYLFQKPSELSELIIQFISDPPLRMMFSIWIFTFQGLIYMFLSLKRIKKYSNLIKNEYSDIEKINLTWLRNITTITLIVWLVVLINNSLKLFIDIPMNQQELPVAIAVSISIYLNGFLGLRQSEIFAPSIAEKDNIPQKNNNSRDNAKILPKKYKKSGLSEEKAKSYIKHLMDLMDEEKIYRESNLTLKDLAKRLSISSHNLSEIINTQLNQTFFEFINTYRIRDVQESMTNPDKENLTIFALALDAGFNSKSSFNSLFKKHTNMTPSQYRKSLNT